MALLLILTYTAICVAIFKLFKIPVKKWTVPTVALGGIVLIGALLVLMNYNHPYSEVARQYYITTPIVPQVRGRVIEVSVEANVPVKKGDVLFRIDPSPFQARVDSLTGLLKGEMVERDRLKEEYDRSASLARKGAGSERDVQTWRLQYETAEKEIANTEGQLEEAQFELENTVMRAPNDGFVAQLALRPGIMASKARPGMVFIPQNNNFVTGWFRQNSMLRLRPGEEAEAMLDMIPGKVFPGKVKYVVPFIGQGQLQPTADLVEFAPQHYAGRVAVVIEFTESPQSNDDLPLGGYGQVAVYTEHVRQVAIIRRILLRMASWMNYLFPLN